MVLMDPNDLKTWARNNHHRFGGALNQYLLGNRGIEESLLDIIEEIHPLRDTSEILKMTKEKMEDVEEDVEEGVDSDWSKWLGDLEYQIKGLRTIETPSKDPLPLIEAPRETVKPPFRFLDLIENGLSIHKGSPLYGTFQGRYYPRVAKETGVRVVEHHGIEGDPRKSIGMILLPRKHEDEEYVLIPPQTTVVVNTVEKLRIDPTVVLVMGAHPTYQAIGLETQSGILENEGPKNERAIEVKLTNPKSIPARIYLGHGICELRFIPLGR